MALRHGKMSALEYRSMATYSDVLEDQYNSIMRQSKRDFELASKQFRELPPEKYQPNLLLLLQEELVQ